MVESQTLDTSYYVKSQESHESFGIVYRKRIATSCASEGDFTSLIFHISFQVKWMTHLRPAKGSAALQHPTPNHQRSTPPRLGSWGQSPSGPPSGSPSVAAQQMVGVRQFKCAGDHCDRIVIRGGRRRDQPYVNYWTPENGPRVENLRNSIKRIAE